VFWFWDAGQMVICAHAIVKKSRKTPQKHLQIAKQRMSAYKAAKKKNQVEILPP